MVMMPSAISPLDGLRVLLLEDEALIAMDVELLCQESGASEVVTLSDLSQIEPHNPPIRFDVAIVDLMLGGISTIGFASDLYERGIPFIFASGSSDLNEIELKFPGVALVSKPYSGSDLIDAVAKSCGRLAA